MHICISWSAATLKYWKEDIIQKGKTAAICRGESDRQSRRERVFIENVIKVLFFLFNG